VGCGLMVGVIDFGCSDHARAAKAHFTLVSGRLKAQTG
jgi:hypothetical protein